MSKATSPGILVDTNRSGMPEHVALPNTVDTNRSGMPEHVTLPNTVDTNRSGMPEHVALPNTAEQMGWPNDLIVTCRLDAPFRCLAGRESEENCAAPWFLCLL